MNDKQPQGSARQSDRQVAVFHLRDQIPLSGAGSVVEAGQVRRQWCAYQCFELSDQARRPCGNPDRSSRFASLIMLLPGERRGPHEEAKLLYEDQSPPPPERSERTPPSSRRRPRGGQRTPCQRRSAGRWTGSCRTGGMMTEQAFGLSPVRIVIHVRNVAGISPVP